MMAPNLSYPTYADCQDDGTGESAVRDITTLDLENREWPEVRDALWSKCRIEPQIRRALLLDWWLLLISVA